MKKGSRRAKNSSQHCGPNVWTSGCAGPVPARYAPCNEKTSTLHSIRSSLLASRTSAYCIGKLLSNMHRRGPNGSTQTSKKGRRTPSISFEEAVLTARQGPSAGRACMRQGIDRNRPGYENARSGGGDRHI